MLFVSLLWAVCNGCACAHTLYPFHFRIEIVLEVARIYFSQPLATQQSNDASHDEVRDQALEIATLK